MFGARIFSYHPIFRNWRAVMLKRFFLVPVFFGLLISNAYSQKMDDLSTYISDLESKLSCPIKTISEKTEAVDLLGRNVNVQYSCVDDKPLLDTAVLLDEKGLLIFEASKTVFETGEIVTREKYVNYYEDGTEKSSEQHIYREGGRAGSGRLTSIYLGYSETSKMTIRRTVNPSKVSEERWEYYPNDVVSKRIIINDNEQWRQEFTIEYNDLSQKIKETEVFYDPGETVPYNSSVTDYDPKTQKTLLSVSYDYEDGVKKTKSVYEYEKGKLVSQTIYELVYDDEGNLVNEKKISKETF